MLDLHFIREHPERVRQAIRDKRAGDVKTVDAVLAADERRRALQTELQELQHHVNTRSKEIGTLMKAGRREEAQAIIAETGQMKERIKALDEEMRAAEARLERLLLELPNVPHPSVPVGHSPEDNVVVHEEGTPPAFDFEPLPHWELADRHHLIDFERGAKVTGAGFPFYVGAGARLQRALLNFFLDLAVREGGYTEIQPPYVVNADSATGTGQLPDKEDLMYEVPRDGLYLIPTAEVPVTNFFRGEILDEADLPVRFCAYTPCFRREAGSYGKDVRGLNRLHQFDKVELVQFVHPEQSYEALEALREDAERVLRRLGLPYRRLLMCTGDMGFTQAKKYDLEVWSAGQQRWLEVSSVSNFEAFQARRMQIRYRPAGGGKPVVLHTLNGSGLAFPRVVAALLEHYQQPDGTIHIPDALQPYTGFDRIG
ncbi:serine--tRNA ligase [Rhodocaloribacter litoris]|uniref:serine--tRNA ligase n=1 Tax=Rhodocaloribacter litoris TaxID=2558931 RepID=UPI001423CCE3|nr:serine--tRNA ligase [Rhodocaloribacter litoris]QXD16308.1 serine--tRNA ligase [Rhodocaloribacter litoris]